MPIISKIGRRSLSTRLLIWSLYALLTAGSITMIYPFLLMMAGSTKSAVDTPDPRVIPPYLVDRRALYQKHVEGLFNESLESMQATYASDTTSFFAVELPAPPRVALVAVWREFLALDPCGQHAYAVGYLRAPVSRGVMPKHLRTFKAQLVDRYEGDIRLLNREMGTKFVDWNSLYVLPKDYLLRRNKPGVRPFDLALREFTSSLPVEERWYFSVEGFFKSAFLKTQYGRNIDGYNRAHGTTYAGWDRVHLDRRRPSGPGRTEKEGADWEEFVRTILNLLWVRADGEAAPVYRRFLEAKYRTIDALNRNYGSTYGSFDQIPIVDDPPAGGLRLSDWDSFLQGWRDPDSDEHHILPLEHIRLHTVEFQFRDFLSKKYGQLAAANAALGTSFDDWLEILPPQQDLHYAAFLEGTGALRWEFTTRNFVTVIDYIGLHGRGIFNTFIYCALSIVAALVVNPLAAYALSRYRPPSTYKVLLFLMLTMAFPPMVTQIPVFLMLREFSLLNTFWALILPGLANGYSIFLLKGFFDSLPRELYESAALDGAGEFRIFWTISMSLSTPILAVIALNAFTHAYSNFMMALLICQDEKMWTLMPWLYQLQQRSGQGVIFASLLVAAIPTFLVFAFCQNVIMRGIVVPVEK